MAATVPQPPGMALPTDLSRLSSALSTPGICFNVALYIG